MVAKEDERRHFDRIERRDKVKVKEYTYPERGNYQDARIIDLSAGGLQLECRSHFPPGTVLKIEMNFSGWQRYTAGFLKYFGTAASRPLVVLAEVVRCQSKVPGARYHVGVRFTGIDESHRRALVKFIQVEVLKR
ncbi:MAG: PilZ domain-containing protein [Deltaproteobacteria bacterium]|nr:MAG: PilZ domain-containing protein [Deltaproteobacteria bacterium]